MSLRDRAMAFVQTQTVCQILTYADSYALLADELFGDHMEYLDEVYSVCLSIKNYWKAMEEGA